MRETNRAAGIATTCCTHLILQSMNLPIVREQAKIFELVLVRTCTLFYPLHAVTGDCAARDGLAILRRPNGALA